MWEWVVEFKALLVFVRSHVGVSRRVQGSARVCRVSCGVGRRVQGSARVCRVSCGSGP